MARRHLGVARLALLVALSATAAQPSQAHENREPERESAAAGSSPEAPASAHVSHDHGVDPGAGEPATLLSWLGRFHPATGLRLSLDLTDAALTRAAGFLGGSPLYGLDHYAW